MKKQQVITINLILLAIWTWILVSFVQMYKTEVYFIDSNPFYSCTLWILYGAALLYAHFFVTGKIIQNLLITSLLFLILHFFSVRLVDIFMDYLMAKDQKTPLGWTFKYRFLDIFILDVFLLLALEIVCYIQPLWKK
ncbi:hypothetical protein [Chitinophaga filiformis]|nr:hypothetical protein [Chitinophaga filiformis]